MNKLINELTNAIRNIKDELEEKGLNIPTIESEIEKIKETKDKLIVLKDEFENKFNAKLEALAGRKNEVYIVIEGDMNDGDYISETSTFDIKDFEEYFPVIKAIYEGKIKHSGEYMTEEEVKYLEKIEYGDDLYNDIVPRGEYGCHSIGIEELKFYDENGAEYDIKFN